MLGVCTGIYNAPHHGHCNNSGNNGFDQPAPVYVDGSMYRTVDSGKPVMDGIFRTLTYAVHTYVAFACPQLSVGITASLAEPEAFLAVVAFFGVTSHFQQGPA